MTVTELRAPDDSGAPVPWSVDDTFTGADDRWRPTRAGLINVWQYAEETFQFEHGRLVLYGPNGSGKTMALELLFPYLLDGDATPYRLSTAGGNERGGLWSRISGYDDGASGRIGYLWAEFTRTLDDGTDETFTCGTRLEPRGGNKGGKHTWFTTSLRVGHELSLLDADRIPLAVERLKAAVGVHGHVWGDDTVGYRNAVRSTLYSDFTAPQYAAMLDGLLAVRKQSITDGLNPDKLHLLLTDGLPPLDPRELDQVARGFEGLDAQRDAIGELEAAVAAADQLAERARRQSLEVVRLAAKDVASTTSKLDKVTRTRREAESSLATANDTAAAAASELEASTDEHAEMERRRKALWTSESYTHLGELDRLAARVVEQGKRATDARQRADDAEAVAAGSAARATEVQRSAEQARGTRDRAVRELRETAGVAGITVGADVDPREAAAQIDTEAQARASFITAVRAEIRRVEDATTDLQRAEAAVTSAAELVERRRNEASAATAAARDAEQAWGAALSSWSRQLVELDVDLDVLDTCSADADLVAAARHIDAALTAAVEALGRQDQTLLSRYEDAAGALELLVAERDALTGATAAAPPAPPAWRAPRTDGRAGAALWQLLAPADDTDTALLDALETALDAAGVLDAWVAPDGTVEHGDLGARPSAPAPAPALISHLRVDTAAAADAGVDAEALTATLESVHVAEVAGTGDPVAAGFTVGRDGSFSFGPAFGRPDVRPAGHIGATARERARQARLDVLAAEIAAAETELSRLDGERAVLAERVRAAGVERDQAPATTEVDAARANVGAAGALVDAAEASHVAAVGSLRSAEDALGGARLALARVADLHQLPATTAALDALANHLHAAERAAGSIPGLCDAADVAAEAAAETAATAERDRANAAGLRASEEVETSSANLLAAEHAELDAAVGADAAATRARVEELNRRIDELDGEIEGLRAKLTSAQMAAAHANGALEGLVVSYDEALAARDAADSRFRTLVERRVVDDAGFDVDWDVSNTTGVRAAAREVNQARGSDEPSTQAAQRHRTELEEARYRHNDTLAGRVEVAISELDVGDLPAVKATATIGGVTMSLTEVAERLRSDLQRARDELADAETELFEQTLTGSLRAHLASRLRAAQGLVDSMNLLLSQIRSASGGVAVSLRWDVAGDLDDDATLRTVKGLLLRDHHSDTERDTLHGFLTRRIEQVRATDRAVTSWRDALERLFDYRLWHRFTILVRHDRYGDRPVAFTSRKVSLSAGEKALVLSLPLFAAVASHYMPRDVGGEPRTCPRFLLLDEIFPKNDRANKRQILSLLTALDLDAVMTSDKDMCDYDTVDGIAIAVIHKDGDVSYSTRLVWNGHEKYPEAADDGSTPHAVELP